MPYLNILVKIFLLFFRLRLNCRIVLIHPDNNHFVAVSKLLLEDLILIQNVQLNAKF